MTDAAEPNAVEPGEDAPAPPGTLISGFVHAQINVSDLERSIAFYEMLGFEVISKGTIKDPGIFAALGVEGTRMRGAFLRIPGRSTKARR
jgi:catechol 2,3-dioxygenase-like lactoylglutathione lyase family enzyme